MGKLDGGSLLNEVKYPYPFLMAKHCGNARAHRQFSQSQVHRAILDLATWPGYRDLAKPASGPA